MVQPSQGFDEHITALIPVLVSTGDEEVQRVVQIPIIVAIEMPSHKVINLLLGLCVQILELVHGREFDHVETVRKHTVWFPLQQMLALESGNVRDRGKHVAGVCSCPLDAVPMVNPALSCFRIYIKVLQIIVEVN